MGNPEIKRDAPEGPTGWLPVIAGLVLGLLGIGLPMIGLTKNLWLGSLVLAFAFAFIAWGCWILEGRSPRLARLRIITICILAIAYSSAVGIQIRAQYEKDHPAAPPQGPLATPAPAKPPITINQTATDSDCSNLVAGSDAQIKCEAEKGRHDKDKNSH